MDEFISVDEALEMLFDKAVLDDRQKLKRLFQYYSRGKIDFYIELFGQHTRYGVLYKLKANCETDSEQIEKLDGLFKLNRDRCDQYFRGLLFLCLGGESKEFEVVTHFDSRGEPYSSYDIYDGGSKVDVVEDLTGRLWQLKHKESSYYNGISVHHIYGIQPEVDDLLIKAEQIAELTQSIKPQKTPHKRADITEKSNKTKMEVLGAALSVLAQFRPQCVSGEGAVLGAKVAKVIEDKAGLFWPETNQAPQEPEVLRKTINEWLKKSR